MKNAAQGAVCESRAEGLARQPGESHEVQAVPELAPDEDSDPVVERPGWASGVASEQLPEHPDSRRCQDEADHHQGELRCDHGLRVTFPAQPAFENLVGTERRAGSIPRRDGPLSLQRIGVPVVETHGRFRPGFGFARLHEQDGEPGPSRLGAGPLRVEVGQHLALGVDGLPECLVARSNQEAQAPSLERGGPIVRLGQFEVAARLPGCGVSGRPQPRHRILGRQRRPAVDYDREPENCVQSSRPGREAALGHVQKMSRRQSSRASTGQPKRNGWRRCLSVISTGCPM